jgi:PAS domain S-box-containing protein
MKKATGSKTKKKKPPAHSTSGDLPESRAGDGRALADASQKNEVWEDREYLRHFADAGNNLESIINAIAEPIFVKDRQHRWVFFNDAACRFIGHPREELLGKTDSDFFKELEARVFYERDEIVFKTGTEDTNEQFLTDARGKCHVVLTKKTRFTDASGQQYIIGISRDITEERQADEAVHESEGKFRDIFNKINDAIHLHEIGEDGRPGKFIDVNDVACQMLQYSRDEMLQHTPLDFATEYHSRPLDRILEELRTVGHAVFETGHTRKDGTIVPVEINTHRITLLGKTVVLAVVRDITERKRVEKALHESEEMHRLVLEFAGISSTLWTPEGHLLMINRYGAVNLGGVPEDFIGKSMDELFGPETGAIYLERIRQAAATGRRLEFEDRVTLSEGDRWFLSAHTCITDASGQANRVMIFSLDITQRKIAEQAYRDSMEQLALAIDGANLGLWDINYTNRTISHNRNWHELLGYDPKETVTPIDSWKQTIHPDDLPRIESITYDHLDGKTPVLDMEYRIRHKEGRWLWIHTIGRVVGRSTDGKPLRMSGINQDITHQKQSDEALRDSEERLNLALDGANLGLWDMHLLTGEMVHNRRWAEMLGFSTDELEKPSVWWGERVHPDDYQNVLKLSTMHRTGEVPLFDAVYRMKHKDGSWRWVHSQGKVVSRDTDGRSLRMIGINQDITEQMRSEETHRNLTEFQESVITNARVWLSVLDPKGKILMWNTAAEEISGYRAEEVIGKNEIWKLLYPQKEYRKDITDTINRIIHDKKYLENFETTIRSKQGNEKVISWNTKGIPDATGRISDYIAIGVDVNDRQLAEKMLRESEERYRTVIENASEAIVVAQDGVLKFANQKTMELLQTTPEMVIGHSFTDFIHPDDRALVFERYNRRLKGENVPVNYDFRLVGENGRLIWVIISAVRIPWEGRPATLNFLTDITERKQVETALRKSQEQYQAVVEGQTEFICRFTPDGKLTFVNDAYCRYFSLDKTRCINNYHSVLLHPEDARKMRQHLTSLTPQNPVTVIEHRIIMPSGEVRWQRWNDRAIFDKDGHVVEYQSVGRDTTEQKQAEEELRKSEERYRTVLENVPDLVLVHRKGNILYINPPATEVMGYTHDELINKQLTDFIASEYHPLVAQAISRRMDGKTVEPYEIEILTKSGGRRIVSVRGSLIEFAGSPASLNVLTDITERKQAEAALRESEEILRSMLDATPAGVGLLVNRVLQKVNHSLCKITMYSEEEMIGQSTRMLYPDDEEFLRVGRELYEQMEREGLGTVEARLRRKDGAPIIVMLSLSPFDPKNLAAGVTATVLDITDRKRADEALHETEERYRSLFDRSLDCVYIHDFSGNFIDANPSALELLGYTRDEITAINFTSLLTPDQIPLARNVIQEVITTGTQKESSEYRVRRKDGVYVDVETNATLLYHEGKPYAIQGFAHDITERKKTEERLKKFNEELERGITERTARINASLEEKVVLLREIHHRVKNNLQIIISLLKLQSRYMTDENTIAAFRECQNRVMAMSLVHEKLYQSEDISKIDLGNYVRFLGNSLFQFFGRRGTGVTFTTDIQNISLDINTAIPVGLITNELVSNSLKYAFPNGRNGEISIAISRKDDLLTIVYKDTGIGIPQDLDWRNAKSLGLRLVISLVEQLFGTIELDRTGGTTFTIVVKEKE